MIRREKVREREKGGWGGRGEVARDYKHTHASKCSNTHTHTHTHTHRWDVIWARIHADI